MPNKRTFLMRSKSFKLAMCLWDAIGKNDNTRCFTHVEAVEAVGRHIGGGLAALRESGVIELKSGLIRSRAKRPREPKAEWVFTRAWCEYMRTHAGVYEYEAAMQYQHKQCAQESPADRIEVDVNVSR